MRLIPVLLLSALCVVKKAQAQHSPSDIDSLAQLHPHKTARHHYVNFDVLKFMKGVEISQSGFGKATAANNFEVQFLNPFALLREAPIHIAYGFSIGYSKMTFHDRTLNFSKDELVLILPSDSIDKSVQKTGHVGLVVLPFVQIGKRIDIMWGGAVHFNVLGNKVTGKGKEDFTYRIPRQVHRISTPLLFQVSYKPGVISLGVFGSYDLRPRFKGPGFEDLRQQKIGISAGINL